MASATAIAEEIRARILAETSLTASAGVSYNKFLAKMASDERKPNGQFVITPKMGPAYVEGLPVGKFHGIGPATQAKMEGLGYPRRRGPEGPDAGVPSGAFRQGGPLLLRPRAGHRRTPRLRRPRPQVRRRRDDVRGRPLHCRGGPRRAGAADRQGLVLLRGLDDPGTDGDAQGEVRRLPADHPQPEPRGPDRFAGRARRARGPAPGAALPRRARASGCSA